jgi:hypothetical protein
MDWFHRLEELRNEQRSAIAHYDFDKAEDYERQINQLRIDVTDAADLSNRQLLAMQLDGRRGKILGNCAKESAGLFQKRAEIQEHFDARYHGIQERQARELSELVQQYRADLERELARPVPEADRVLRRSKLLGQQRKFTQARVAYQDSLRLRELAREERRRACNAIFQKNQRAMKMRHDRELQAFAQKQNYVLGEVDQSVSNHESLLSTRLHVSELRCATESSWRAMSTMSTRRARSVQKSKIQPRSASTVHT